MKKIKGFLILQALILLIIPFSFAEMSITLPDKETYNLGEKIIPTVSVKEVQDFDGFFKASIICDNVNLQYYTTPLNVEAGIRVQVDVAELTLFESMKNKCRIKAGFDATNGEIISTITSDEFEVTNKLEISLDGDLEAKPGEEVLISAEIKTQSNELLLEGETTLTYNNLETKINVSLGKVEHIIKLSDNAKTRGVPVAIVVKDKYGNYGDEIIQINVVPIPTSIENRFGKVILNPGENINVKVILYDHNDEVVNGSEIDIKIVGPDEKVIVEKKVQSMSSLVFETQKNQMPGTYVMLSNYKDIEEKNTFTIEEIKKVEMNQEGSLVYVENIGNVDYNDEITIILESDGKKYLVNKKIKLKPLEKISLDLSKEVPQGVYDITLPEETVEELSTEEDEAEKINESAQDVFGPVNLIKNVPIEDNRNVIKKTGDGLTAVTGAVISTAKIIASKPTLASIILVVIILGTVTYYSRGFLVEKIKRKKPQDESNLFEDFEYNQEEK
jgi:hypothetical protein